MPEDPTGPPFPDGEGPDSPDHGAADEAFDALVLDEAFVAAARVHEPSAAERSLDAALERAEREAARERAEPFPDGDPLVYDHPFADPADPGAAFPDPGFGHTYGYGYGLGHGIFPDAGNRTPGAGGVGRPAGGSGRARSGGTPDAAGVGPRPPEPPARWPGRWQRPVACVLAVVMGLSVIAFALVSIDRGAGRGEPAGEPAPPAELPEEAGSPIGEPAGAAGAGSPRGGFPARGG
ncbi:hypothetical protein GCM10027160_12050 [Streptomyces calidiresistens]|uniref:Uncharacterized protein n=1 Tax=Streptomyces calidiresistens TaxID=1485586 RepID=A0A7W3T1L0_9ACTN|nr:hypothetical protein [Streptomyces calidiresistens]MBB0229260.1 hypothetical protein [Streptomyces calidiresistens]